MQRIISLRFQKGEKAISTAETVTKRNYPLFAKQALRVHRIARGALAHLGRKPSSVGRLLTQEVVGCNHSRLILLLRTDQAVGNIVGTVVAEREWSRFHESGWVAFFVHLLSTT